LHEAFPRIVPRDEIPAFFALHPEFTPLIDRRKAILSTDPKARAGLVDRRKRLRRFPLPPPTGRFNQKLWIE